MILKNLPSQISSSEKRLAALKGKYLQEWYDSQSGCEHLNGRFMLKFIDCKWRLGLHYRKSTREIYFPFQKPVQQRCWCWGSSSARRKPAQVRRCLGKIRHICSCCFAVHWVGARNKDCYVASKSEPQPCKALRTVLSSWTKCWFTAVTSLRRCYYWSQQHLHKSNFCLRRHIWAKFCPVSSKVQRDKDETRKLKSRMNRESNSPFLLAW